MSRTEAAQRRLRRRWDRYAAGYDRQFGRSERRYFADTRAWIARQATGTVLEVAMGTGLNLPHYPPDVRVVGVEWSRAMLAVARGRSTRLPRRAALGVADAQALPFVDGAFDTVVCTFSLCAIPDERRALREMVRVLRPGGLLLLADHVLGARWYVRAAQRVLDLATVPLAGEHYGRRPLPYVSELGLTIERHDRFALGVIERLAARKACGRVARKA